MNEHVPGELPDEEPDDSDHRALLSVLAEFMDETGLDEADLAPMLIDIAYHYRALGYAVGVGKPSESGLRLDLDRFRKHVEDVHRDYRKNAGEVLKDLVSMLDGLAAAGEQEEP